MQRRALMAGVLVAVLVAVLVGAVLASVWGPRDGDTPSAGSSSSPSTSSPSSTNAPGATPAATTTAGGAGLIDATAEPPPAASAPVATGPTLRIPGIGLEKRLHSEGLRDGKINPPAGSVMWFTGYDRVRPGEVGTALIAGHVVAGGRADAFADLAQVRVGDRIEVEDTDGSTVTFAVVRAGVVDKDDLTTDQTVWGANRSVRRLAIVTCDDAYGFRSDGHRVANYVVVAEPL